MKTFKNSFAVVLLLLVVISMSLTQCKKEKETVTVTDTVYVNPNDTGVFVPGTAVMDTTWTCDQVHCNINWASRYYDLSFLASW